MTKIANNAIMRNAELKYATQQYSSPITITGNVTQLSVVSNGVTDSQRVGDEIEWRTMEVRFTLDSPLSIVAATPSVTRCIIFQWHDDNTGFTPVLANILDTSRGPSPPTMPFLNDYYGGNRMFSVLYDQCYSINNYGKGCLFKKIVLRQSQVGAKKIRFVSQSSTAGFQQLYVMFISDQGTGGSPPLLNLGTMLRFVDT